MNSIYLPNLKFLKKNGFIILCRFLTVLSKQETNFFGRLESEQTQNLNYGLATEISITRCHTAQGVMMPLSRARLHSL